MPILEEEQLPLTTYHEGSYIIRISTTSSPSKQAEGAIYEPIVEYIEMVLPLEYEERQWLTCDFFLRLTIDKTWIE